MKFALSYTTVARADLIKIGHNDSRRVVKKLDFWISQSDPLHFAKPLKGGTEKKYRFRVGDYRIIFQVNSAGEITILLILKIAHRREIYRV